MVLMSEINLETDIRPISDLKRQASSLVDHVTRSRRPVVLTRHGRGVAVLVSVEEYEALHARAERATFDRAIAAADRDIAEGRTTSQSAVAEKYRSREPASGA